MNIDKQKVFTLFKYTVFLLLTFNIWLFYQEESLASLEIYPNGVTLTDIISAFSATIDTAAWVLLLWLFELETALIPDHKLKGSLKWWLLAIRTLCYGFIVSALFGYSTKLSLFLNAQPFATEDVCALMTQGYTYVHLLDEYFPLTSEICTRMNTQELMLLPNTLIIGDVDSMNSALYLTLVDVINASSWILVLIMLEIEVYLQVRQELSKRFMHILLYFKVALYSVLLLCAGYWGFQGDFLDFWDAFLWLVAFFCIELNIFNWNEETSAHTQVVEAAT